MGLPLLPRCVHSAQHLSRHLRHLESKWAASLQRWKGTWSWGTRTEGVKFLTTADGRARAEGSSGDKGPVMMGRRAGGAAGRRLEWGARDYGSMGRDASSPRREWPGRRAGAGVCFRRHAPCGRGLAGAAAWVTAGARPYNRRHRRASGLPGACVPRLQPVHPRPLNSRPGPEGWKPALRPPAAPTPAAAVAGTSRRRRRVITGVSGRAHLSTWRGPSSCPGSWGGDQWDLPRREVGAREGYPGPGHLPRSPLSRDIWKSALIPSRAARDISGRSWKKYPSLPTTFTPFSAPLSS